MTKFPAERRFLKLKTLMNLPVEERRRVLEEQAKVLQKHYEGLAKQEESGGGEFFDY
jgi:hypothetical protein